MAAHSARSRQILDIQGADATIHELADPEVVAVEFEAYGTVIPTGERFRFPSSIGVIRVRDGYIVSYRDYPNVIGGAAAAGTLRQLAASLSA
jgi:ketosteroid isomerase-like protein